MRTGNRKLILAALLASPVFGQDLPPQANPGGWRKFGERASEQPAQPAFGEAAPPPASDQGPQAGPASREPRRYESPSELKIPAGTWITVRVDQTLSSDFNQPGDAFMSTLSQPLVVDGFVIARRGQTIGGRVAEVQKGGRVKGTSSLSIELTEVSLADGQQIPVRTQFIQHSGGTSVGRDATAIGTTTGVGAAIGAAAAGGFGAGMGAIAGAGASAIGVLVTRGHATVVHPESMLTFRITEPVTIHSRSAQGFYTARQEDYEPRLQARQPAPQPRLLAPAPYYYGGGGYPYFGGSYGRYYGPRFSVYRGYGRRW